MDECDKRNRAATARFGEKGKWDLKDGQARKITKQAYRQVDKRAKSRVLEQKSVCQSSGEGNAFIGRIREGEKKKKLGGGL